MRFTTTSQDQLRGESWSEQVPVMTTIIGIGHMVTPPPVDRQTHCCENITFPQLRWRAVTMLCLLLKNRKNYLVITCRNGHTLIVKDLQFCQIIISHLTTPIFFIMGSDYLFESVKCHILHWDNWVKKQKVFTVHHQLVIMCSLKYIVKIIYMIIDRDNFRDKLTVWMDSDQQNHLNFTRAVLRLEAHLYYCASTPQLFSCLHIQDCCN